MATTSSAKICLGIQTTSRLLARTRYATTTLFSDARRLRMTLNPILSSAGRARASYSTLPQANSHSLNDLPSKRTFRLKDTPAKELLCLEWSKPPRNLLLIKKDCSDATTDALLDFTRHVVSTYPGVNIVVEPRVSAGIGEELLGRHFTLPESDHSHLQYQDKVDLVVTFGGDGTILHAASLFATSSHVPPILSFSMGTLGFLSEWKFSEYKRAIREVYMSGAASERHAVIEGEGSNDFDCSNDYTGWSSVRGKSMGPERGARVLVRQRLKVGVFDANGNRLSSRDPHLAIVNVYVGGRFLTEAVADGMIVSTPTGSTAYSLSTGGSIVHPLVPSLLLTPICPRSLSFRPLVLPSTTPITLKLSDKNRGREVDVSIDGMRRTQGIGVGTEVRVSAEEITTDAGAFTGGIPCIMRTISAGADGDDGWVGGLNGLLKFNYPFGEEK
ncbi:hypothetical protein CLAIMM_10029 [Cladophialophora immunda]|nr:hypothetical protein CLAIMM_10029 [Cladophialophora immunda]